MADQKLCNLGAEEQHTNISFGKSEEYSNRLKQIELGWRPQGHAKAAAPFAANA
jgi:hypothetical protein